jgi:uncharacterized protein (TIGR02271 family)
MESSTYGRVTDWNDVIKKEARGLNNADLGEVQEVNEIMVVTERGNISKEKFYLPKAIPHGYNGCILLFDITEDDAKQKFMTEPATQTSTATTSSSSTDSSKVPDIDSDETRVQVIEERLDVSKKESVEEVTVVKEPLKETKTGEVQLTHEELIIEKRAASKMTSPTTTSTSEPSPPTSPEELVHTKTEINIPLMREEIIVSKKPYVKEEIVIKKNQ